MDQKLSGDRAAPIIRQATRNDLAAILDLVRELAVYERAPDKVTSTLQTYEADFDAGYFEALVAEQGEMILGMALYYKAFSTWRGRMMYLEDFIVKEAYRRLGVGKLLFEAFLEKSREQALSSANGRSCAGMPPPSTFTGNTIRSLMMSGWM